MNECVNGCGTELTGRQKTYCSDKCRKQAERKSDKPEQKSDIVRVTAEVGQTRTEDNATVATLTASQLYLAIHNYRQDTWKDSAEYKELTRRLHSLTVEQLKTQGFRVPAWKYESQRIACPSVA